MGPFHPTFKSDAMRVWHIIKAWTNNRKKIVSQLNTQKMAKNGHIIFYNLDWTLLGSTTTQTQNSTSCSSPCASCTCPSSFTTPRTDRSVSPFKSPIRRS